MSLSELCLIFYNYNNLITDHTQPQIVFRFPLRTIKMDLDLRNTLYVELNPYRSYFSVELYQQLLPILRKHPEIEVYDVAKKGRPEWLPCVPVFYNQNQVARIGPTQILREFATLQVVSGGAVAENAVPPVPVIEESKDESDSDSDDESWCKPMKVEKDGSNDDVAARVMEMEKRRAERERSRQK